MIQYILRWLKKRKGPQFNAGKAVLLAFGLNIFFGTAFYFAEYQSQDGLTYSDSIWWAMVTMTTVGYGDFFPVTFTGRFLISYPCMLIGIGIIGYLAGGVAEVVLERVSKKRRGLMAVKESGHLIICNCPSEEKVVELIKEIQAHPLYKDKQFVVITESFEELPEALKMYPVQFVRGNPSSEEILVKANIENCSGVFVLALDPKNPASDEKTFAVATIIEHLKREKEFDINVVVELVHKENYKMMQHSNVDRIVTPDGITSCLLVQEFLHKGIHNIINQILTNTVGSQFFLIDTKLNGFSVHDVQHAVLEHPEDIQIIGIMKQGQCILNPAKSTKIETGDQLVVGGFKNSDSRSAVRRDSFV